MSYKAFVSSTFEDLKEHRAHVIRALRRAGFFVDPMEDWPADSDEPKRFSQDRLTGCDLCVLLVAFRRGYVPEGEIRSITQLEYDAAVKQGIDIVPFLLDENAAWPRKFDELEKDPELKAWRDHLGKRHGREVFTLEPRSIDLTATLGRWFGKKHASETEQVPNQRITWPDGKSPYPGLMNFTREDAPVFFGRDVDIKNILDRMELPEGRFILVSGDSGVGKSSLVAAGVLPHIENAGLPSGETCEILYMLPGKSPQPWDSLMAAGLGALVTRAGLRWDAMRDDLTRDPEALAGHINTIFKNETQPHTLLLFLDQMEELFTLQDLTQSNRFLTALHHATEQQALWVVATIRSDHLHYCHRHPEMVKVLRGQGYYPLGRVDRSEMQEMIVKPAQCAGLKISDRLVGRLIDDTGGDSANLPLLAFALNQLFEQRHDHELSETLYKAMGGVGGAIAAHVKQVEDKIQQDLGCRSDEALPGIFHTLANVQKEEGLPTRNRPPLTGFHAQERKVVDLLVNERLLRTEGEGETATVSLSHEKLFEAWPSLKEYVEKNKKQLVDRTLLESRARKWAQMDKPWFSGLASGREYTDFRRAEVAATGLTKEYLQTSRLAKWIQTGTIAVLLLLVGGILFWLWQEGRQGMTVEQAVLKAISKVWSIHLTPAMETVPGGTFRQGDLHGRGDKTEQSVQEVTIKPFAIGKFEVTFDEYDRFALSTNRLPLPPDQTWGRGRRPVINVSWDDAKAYATWLSEATGKRYRLPTESEWEYAARSIAKNKDHIWAGTSEEAQLKEYAVYEAARTEPVGGKKPNSLGLHDMSGNVWEWVEDCWHENYNGAPPDGSAWLEAGDGDCSRRVRRGGSWVSEPESLRASLRNRNDPDFRNLNLGFRLVQDLP
ncbi:MAG: hypothetical protein OJF50_006285 [Nitrospira sp.]|jgi:formylglycine-generating enzyme required for sulfatase activity/energy-coupling factor transporter ATP-binding protein EcfA2|nr:hypothetical protein [Nitrospira sp.]